MAVVKALDSGLLGMAMALAEDQLTVQRGLAAHHQPAVWPLSQMRMGSGQYRHDSASSRMKPGTAQRKAHRSQWQLSSAKRRSSDGTAPCSSGWERPQLPVEENIQRHRFGFQKLSYGAKSLRKVTMSHNIQRALGFRQPRCMRLLGFSAFRVPTEHKFLSGLQTG